MVCFPPHIQHVGSPHMTTVPSPITNVQLPLRFCARPDRNRISRCVHSPQYNRTLSPQPTTTTRTPRVYLRNSASILGTLHPTTTESQFAFTLLSTTVPSPHPTCWIDIHVFLWCDYKNMNNVFRRINPVYDMDTYIFKVNVFTQQAKYE